MRLDNYLVKTQMLATRSKARLFIIEGKVMVNGLQITKAGHMLKGGEEIRITSDTHYVGRGAEKLIFALDKWKIPVTGVCIDIGASTGGFTQVLLERGATKVLAVDTGKDQLSGILAKDRRVLNLERTDIRRLELKDHGISKEDIGLITMDLSFISVTEVFECISALVFPKTRLITMVKPQFEVGRAKIGKNGIVKNEKYRIQAIESVIKVAGANGFELVSYEPSPILGGSGNHEYIAHFVRKVKDE